MSIREEVETPDVGLATASEPMPSRWSTFRKSAGFVFLVQVVAFVLVILIWDFVEGRFVAKLFIGDPKDTFTVLFNWIITGEIFVHIGTTLLEALIGFVIGVVLAIPFGIWSGTNQHANHVISPFLAAGYAVPKIALAPLLVIWLGLGLGPKVTLAVMISFFLVFRVVVSAIRDVNADLSDQVYLFGGKRADVFLKVILPSISLHIIYGMKLSFPMAMHGAIVGELIASTVGLGHLISFSQETYNTSMMLAALIVLALVTVGVLKVIDLLVRFVPSPK